MSTEFATSTSDRTPAASAYLRFLESRKAHRACACGRQATHYRFTGEQSAGQRCGSCAGGDPQTLKDADRNRSLALMRLQSKTSAPTSRPTLRRSSTRPRTDAERFALLARLQRGAV